MHDGSDDYENDDDEDFSAEARLALRHEILDELGAALGVSSDAARNHEFGPALTSMLLVMVREFVVNMEMTTQDLEESTAFDAFTLLGAHLCVQKSPTMYEQLANEARLPVAAFTSFARYLSEFPADVFDLVDDLWPYLQYSSRPPVDAALMPTGLRISVELMYPDKPNVAVAVQLVPDDSRPRANSQGVFMHRLESGFSAARALFHGGLDDFVRAVHEANAQLPAEPDADDK